MPIADLLLCQVGKTKADQDTISTTFTNRPRLADGTEIIIVPMVECAKEVLSAHTNIHMRSHAHRKLLRDNKN